MAHRSKVPIVDGCRWAVVYTNGDKYSSDKYRLDELPDQGVQIFSIWYEQKGQINTTHLFYPDEYILPNGRVLYGKQMPDDEFVKLVKQHTGADITIES